MAQWTYGLCGCFDDCELCLLTAVVPCVTAGRNAEATGQGTCLSCGIVYPFAGWWFSAQSRKKTREMRGIEGSFCEDLAFSCFLPFCSMIQTARELSHAPPQQTMQRS